MLVSWYHVPVQITFLSTSSCTVSEHLVTFFIIGNKAERLPPLHFVGEVEDLRLEPCKEVESSEGSMIVLLIAFP